MAPRSYKERFLRTLELYKKLEQENTNLREEIKMLKTQMSQQYYRFVSKDDGFEDELYRKQNFIVTRK